jgi:type I restriction enzyme M protein
MELSQQNGNTTVLQSQFRNNDKEIYAPLKDKWFVATPEEKVRQSFICYLM